MLFYTNARLNSKTALLAGPFQIQEHAARYIDVCGPMFVDDEPASLGATFGVMSCNAFAGYGIYNKILRALGDLNCPVADN